MERAQGQKAIEDLGKKLQTASANRTVQLTNIQEKAKNHNQKVQLVRERKSSQEKAQEERQSELAKRHTNAEERLVEKLSTIQEKRKTYNEKVQKVVQSKVEESKDQLDNAKAKIEDKMTRTASSKKDTQERAKAYNEKH